MVEQSGEVGVSTEVSKLDNFKGNIHKLTKADNARGGRKMTELKMFTIKLLHQRGCGPKCPYFPCTIEPLSRIKYKGECAMKKQPPEIVKRFYRFMIDGTEQEFLKEMRNALIKLSIKESPADFIKYGEKVHKMLFGDKRRTEVTGKFALTNAWMEAVKETMNEEEEKSDGVGDVDHTKETNT